MAGEYLEPSNWPLWMQSGGMNAPPQGSPLLDPFNPPRVRGPIDAVKDAFTLPRDEQGVPQAPSFWSAIPLALMAMGGRMNSMAKRPTGIYNAPNKTPRSFEADYPSGAPVNEAGRLAVDIEGRPLNAPYVAGRRLLGGPDEAIPSTEFNALAEATTGQSAQAVAPRQIGNDLGRIGINRVTGQPEYIVYRNNLPPDKAGMAVSHELGHAVDEIAGQIPVKGLLDELKGVYNTLGNPNRAAGGLESAPWGKPWTPKASGYSGEEVPRELIAESIRAYMTNPNYLKTVAPNVAARIRQFVNSHPQLSKIIQFNTMAGAGVLAGSKGEKQ